MALLPCLYSNTSIDKNQQKIKAPPHSNTTMQEYFRETSMIFRPCLYSNIFLTLWQLAKYTKISSTFCQNYTTYISISFSRNFLYPLNLQSKISILPSSYFSRMRFAILLKYASSGTNRIVCLIVNVYPDTPVFSSEPIRDMKSLISFSPKTSSNSISIS